MTLLELFCEVDDFNQELIKTHPKNALPSTTGTRERALSMTSSEIMTILILFHQQRYRDFKWFYTQHVCVYLRSEFPTLPSYNRFVEWIPRSVLPLSAYLFAHLGRCSGISFVDSTKLSVCHNRRIHNHKVFSGLAARGKTSVGWFFGFKLHLLFNDAGEIIWLDLSAGNLDDRKGLLEMLENPFSNIFHKIFGDKGYISKALFQKLIEEHGVQLITRLKKNMKCEQPMPNEDALFLRKRSIVETIIDQCKNISQIEHSRHRSPMNFLANLICGLIAYCHREKKPSLQFMPTELTMA
ncbi:MAG: hypothetical protein RLZZ156_767 [Deinococcota bacterium]|jgi:hypothetical protein